MWNGRIYDAEELPALESKSVNLLSYVGVACRMHRQLCRYFSYLTINKSKKYKAWEGVSLYLKCHLMHVSKIERLLISGGL